MKRRKQQHETQKTYEKAIADQKKTNSKMRVTAQLDAQAQEDVSNFSVHPDLDSDDDIAPGMEPHDEDASELLSSGGDSDGGRYEDSNEGGKGIDEDNDVDESNVDDKEIRLRKEKKKASKTSIRDEIAAIRDTRPKFIHKRAGSDTEKNPTSSKRSKLSDMGGLKDGWKSNVDQKKSRMLPHKASHSSLASSDTGTVDIEFERGEFDQDVSAETLEVQCAGKSQHKQQLESESKHVVDVKLEAADANSIVKEERETGKPAQPPKRAHVKVSDVPFVLPTDHEVWNQHICTSLIEWSSRQTNQFRINSDPGFRQKVQELWNLYLMPLHHISLDCTGPKGKTIKRSDHPALFSFAQADIRNYRSRVGKSALKIVEAYLELKGSTAVEQKQLVEELIHHDSFVYKTPGLTRETSAGAFRGELIMRTMAFYLTWALAAPNPAEGYPTGALALATTAVLQALNIFKTGYSTSQPDTTTTSYSAAKKKKPVNSPDNFSDKWASDAMRFFNLIQRLKGNKWELILHASERYILNIPNAGAGPYLKVTQREAEKASNTQHEMVKDLDDDILLSD
ncbi:hypothetical protein F5050DRAFT_1710139 [Lentinula boryana]|uniref:DUF6532 domain-containing protein n=1 Tax=Lentinula boryana TaxID=40481 RepID=A0ABQ8QK09_9AGAR|nr:hypothetical protein F5050DRAFT_1710139 [Lentinula boryana]